jgi:hypothetical protein
VIPDKLPNEIAFDAIEKFDDLDTRVAAIDCLFINIVGVNEGYVEWCPNESPYSREEYFAWVWLVTPSLGEEIIRVASTELQNLIRHYQSNKMEQWFEYIAT